MQDESLSPDIHPIIGAPPLIQSQYLNPKPWPKTPKKLFGCLWHQSSPPYLVFCIAYTISCLCKTLLMRQTVLRLLVKVALFDGILLFFRQNGDAHSFTNSLLTIETKFFVLVFRRAKQNFGLNILKLRLFTDPNTTL